MARPVGIAILAASLLLMGAATAETSNNTYPYATWYYGGGDNEGNCGGGTYIEYGPNYAAPEYGDYWDFPWLANGTSASVQGYRYYNAGGSALARTRTFSCQDGVVIVQ